MINASLHVDPAFVVAPVSRRTFGSFVEHMGRNVYTGLYEPGHPTADADGFREDVLELVRELGVTVVRYPGGNFVSGYRWEDGVGPVAERPTRLDPAWRTIETNEFGLNEFARWAAKADLEVMLAVNLGTRGMPEAIELLEYANHPHGTYLVGPAGEPRSRGAARDPDVVPGQRDGRAVAAGAQDGGGVRAVGRRDGPGHAAVRPPPGAGRVRQLPPLDADLRHLGGHRPRPRLRRRRLHLGHAYYELQGNDLASFLASSLNMESFIRDVVSTADHVAARLSTTKRINISFDEWNVWYVQEMHERDLPKDWTVAPRLSEDPYTVADAVVVGSLLVTLLRNSDRVTSACQAQLVNAIGSIRTEPGGPAWRQSIFHPFAQMAALAKGTVLRTEIKAPTYDTSRYGEAPVVDVAATHDDERNELVLFVVNRHPSEPVDFTTNLRAFPGARLEAATVLADDDWRAANTQQQPDRVVPRAHPDAAVDEGTLRAVLPPVSWNVFRLPCDAS